MYKMYNTYRCVVRGKYTDPEDMISFDTSGIENIDALRSELCSIPKKDTGSGLYQILGKAEMKKLGIASPNLADAIMMTMWIPEIEPEWGELDYQQRCIV